MTLLNIASLGPKHFIILGIDPGSSNLGIAALHVNIDTMDVQGCEMVTLNALKPTGGRQINNWMLDTHSERSMRLRELAWMLGQQFMLHRPLLIACEAPFFNPRNPNAYQVLVEVMKTVENALYAWNPWRPLYRIETTAAKKAVAPLDPVLLAESKLIKDSKEKIKFCVVHHPVLSNFINPLIHDEHSIDAAVVAYTQLLRIRNGDYSITF